MFTAERLACNDVLMDGQLELLRYIYTHVHVQAPIYSISRLVLWGCVLHVVFNYKSYPCVTRGMSTLLCVVHLLLNTVMFSFLEVQ